MIQKLVADLAIVCRNPCFMAALSAWCACISDVKQSVTQVCVASSPGPFPAFSILHAFLGQNDIKMKKCSISHEVGKSKSGA